ncbi:hypothetical protein AtEden1_Chr2g0267251 [Arabidopsis thaliana]
MGHEPICETSSCEPSNLGAPFVFFFFYPFLRLCWFTELILLCVDLLVYIQVKGA